MFLVIFNYLYWTVHACYHDIFFSPFCLRISHFCNMFCQIKRFCIRYLSLSPLIIACYPIMQTQTQKHILPKTSCSARSNEKGVNCLQVLLCWCVLAGAAFTSVAKHREICSAVLSLSTMEDSKGRLTEFGAVSEICSQDLDCKSLQSRKRWRGGSSHSTKPRWVTEIVSTRCTFRVGI